MQTPDHFWRSELWADYVESTRQDPRERRRWPAVEDEEDVQEDERQRKAKMVAAVPFVPGATAAEEVNEEQTVEAGPAAQAEETTTAGPAPQTEEREAGAPKVALPRPFHKPKNNGLGASKWATPQ